MPTTMVVPTMFWKGVFLYSPMVFLSLRRRIRNTRAAGRRVTATTWTKRVMRTRGALGIRVTIPALTRLKKKFR
jgi:hypothetical protein